MSESVHEGHVYLHQRLDVAVQKMREKDISPIELKNVVDQIMHDAITSAWKVIGLHNTVVMECEDKFKPTTET